MSLKRNRSQWEKELQDKASPFVYYGTPLPPLDPDVRDDGSFVPVWKQEVRDERGRKRLHGAFTGGFSAGYFNTVGSKEGWTPSTFKSSRTERASAVQVRPEDFMDEEDLREQEEARQVRTAEGFSGLGSTAEELANRRPVLMDLFVGSGEESIGKKLLKRMGWKEGQGVGPKVRRKARGDMGTEEGEEHFFAPDDTKLVGLVRKNDARGLGYENADSPLRLEKRAKEEEDEDDTGHMPSFVKKPKAKKPARTGFGVGILNDDDEEEDPYEIKPKSAYNRVIGGDEKKKKTAKPIVKAPARHVFISKKANKFGVDSRKCHDGKLPLEGFVLASEPLTLNDNWYEAPEVPEDWTPAVSEGIEDTIAKAMPSLKDMAANSKLDAKARGALLGEEQLPGKSVFDFLTPEARAKLVAATGRADLPPALGEKVASSGGSAFDPRRFVPQLDPTAAISALNHGFMPYADDTEKRQRYRKYLEDQAGLHNDPPEQPPKMSREDWLKELQEFHSAANLYKPMSGAMANRFTSSRSASSYISSSNVDEDEVLIHRPEKVEDPAEQAAKVGMYGPMTRRVETWFPSRLLCKRFGVKPPASATEGDEGSHKSSNREDNSWRDKMGGAPQPARHAPPPQPPAGPKALVSDEDLVQIMREAKGDESYVLPEREKPVEIDVERNPALEGNRAADDVFKAIFGDSDDEE